MGDYSPHGTGPGDFPEQGDPSSHIKASTAASGRKLGVPPLGGCDGLGNAGGGFGGGGGVRLEAKEYGRAVLLNMDLCKKEVQSKGTWVSKRL